VSATFGAGARYVRVGAESVNSEQIRFVLTREEVRKGYERIKFHSR
jgi:hypothetical protein